MNEGTLFGVTVCLGIAIVVLAAVLGNLTRRVQRLEDKEKPEQKR